MFITPKKRLDCSFAEIKRNICQNHIALILFLPITANSDAGNHVRLLCFVCRDNSFPSQLLPLCSDFQSKLDPQPAHRERKLGLLQLATEMSAWLAFPAWTINVSLMLGEKNAVSGNQGQRNMYIKEKRNIFSFSCLCSYGSAFTVTQTLEEIVFFFLENWEVFFLNSSQDLADFNQVILSSLFVIAINLQKCTQNQQPLSKSNWRHWNWGKLFKCWVHLLLHLKVFIFILLH